MMRFKFRWPWDSSEADAAADRLDERAAKVQRIHREATRQRAENHIGPMLEALFTIHPKEPR